MKMKSESRYTFKKFANLTIYTKRIQKASKGLCSDPVIEVCYYCIGTTTAELRGFWISWSMPMLFMAAQVLIMRLDIVRTSGNHMLPNAEWIGHVAPYFAVAATTMEYRYLYSPTTVMLTWVFVFLAYFGHFVMVSNSDSTSCSTWCDFRCAFTWPYVTVFVDCQGLAVLGFGMARLEPFNRYAR